MTNKTRIYRCAAAMAAAACLIAPRGAISPEAHAAEMNMAGMTAQQHSAHGMPGHDHSGGHTHTTRLIVSSQPAPVMAGQRATWRLKIVDDLDGSPISNFDKVHDKLLHLIVVSKDLAWFNHLHPVYKGNGVFEVTTVIPRAGRYKLYADYRPTEREGEVAQHEFTVSGAHPRPARPALKADTLKGGWLRTAARSGTEESPHAPAGPLYHVALMPMPAAIRAGQDVMLHFRVLNAAGKPVRLEPYLGAGGHLVLLSADSNTYLHTHPMEAAGASHPMNHSMKGMNMKMDMKTPNDTKSNSDSDVMFHTNFPTPGLYKGWGQFKHAGKIITAAFVLNVGAAAVTAPATAAAAKAAPAKAHSAGKVQRVTVIIDHEYKPALVNVRAGKPVELTFVRREKEGCGDTVVIPALKQRFSLKTGARRTVRFTPKRNQTISFSCGMDMYHGKVQAK